MTRRQDTDRLRRPTAPNNAVRQAVALQSQGRLDEAAHLYEAILKTDSGSFAALHNLGVIRIRQGKLDEARRLLRKATNQEPGSAEAHNNLGNALQMLGAHAEAIARYEKALALKPDHVDAVGNLGVAYQATGRLDEAVACFRRVCEMAPGTVGARLNLARSLHSLDRNEDALPAVETALALAPNNTGALILLGMVLEAMGRPEAAIDRLEFALTIAPENTEALVILGRALRTAGRFAEARRALERAVALAPTNARYLLKLVETTQLSADDPLLAVIEGQLRDRSPEADDYAMHLSFAMGKAYADLGRHDESMHHFLEANRRKRSTIAYDEAATLSALRRIPERFTSALMNAKTGLGHPSDVPIFIVGMPRSGTTLIEQILASHPSVFGAGELPYFAAAAPQAPQEQMSGDDLRGLGESYLARIRPLAPTAKRIVDKMPGNFERLGLIHLALPNARLIHVRRDPVDTCLSCFSLLFGEQNQPFAYDLAELGRYYRAYERLMDHWRRVLPQATFLDVQYEEVVKDLEGQARAIVAHCGLEWDDSCLGFHKTQRPVRTASQAQVRQPIYRSSVGRWLPYKDLLKPLLEALEIEAADAGA